MITLTKEQIETVVKNETERRRSNPWDAEGDEQRMFTALVFDEAKKHVPVLLAMFLMTTMMCKSETGADKEKAIEKVTSEPTLVKMVADLIYLGYRLGKLDA